MRISSRILFFIVLLLPLTALAASEGHGDGVPWKTVGIQAFNFIFLMSLLVYLTKKTIVAHFAERGRSYGELVSKAEEAKREAEQNHREISERLNQLRNSARDNANKAKADATDLKHRLISEANEIARKLKVDAEKTAEIEVQKAKNDIRAYALAEALRLAEDKMSKQPEALDHKRLQSEFIEKIQAVNQ